MTDRHIAIIGGGASAALLLIQLAKGADVSGWTVDVYDRAGRFGRGVAYSTTQLCHLLNVRAAGMSVFQEAPDDFAVWAGTKGYNPLDFAPRPLYALYLAERMDQAMRRFSSVQFIEGDVQSTRKISEGRYDVTLEGGHKTYTDVIVATGNVKALGPVVDDATAYYAEPWRVDYDALRMNNHIALIGTGLSAVDAIQSLVMAGYKGIITAVSRNGLFPAAHVPPASYPAFLSDGQIPSPSRLMHLIREHAECSEGPWQAVIDSLRPFTNIVWQGWTPEQRSIFLRRALTHWNIHRHRMAPENAVALQKLQQKGQLRIVKDKVLKVAGDKVVCASQILQADAIINCMGYRYDEGRDFESSHRIGPARFGELFETTAIPEIRAQAFEIANALKN